MDDKHVFATHIFINLDENFLIVEPFNPRLDQTNRGAAMDRHTSRDGLGQWQIGIARNELGFVG